jgi:hypothetical protein
MNPPYMVRMKQRGTVRQRSSENFDVLVKAFRVAALSRGCNAFGPPTSQHDVTSESRNVRDGPDEPPHNITMRGCNSLIVPEGDSC